MPQVRVASFSARVTGWQRKHGRHDLPWQNTRDAYRIWVSEIMLQQTQVAAVIGYYGRFLTRFPDVATLAAASEEEVMRHWAGLGYYSRARNLHAAARIIVADWGGVWPKTAEALETLPGIGRSTAAAIAVFSCGARSAILDGNVKRVLARHLGVAGYPGERKVEEWLWERALALLPKSGIESYTQGLMDLGATLCTRSRPDCAACPVRIDCLAFVEGRTGELPHRKPQKAVPQRACVMPILLHAGEVLLEKRPSPGIWGGLWCLPQFANVEEAKQALGLPASVWRARQVMEPVEHGFTHFHLTIEPLLFGLPANARRGLDAKGKPRGGRIWLPLAEVSTAALPAPVKKLLRQLAETMPSP